MAIACGSVRGGCARRFGQLVATAIGCRTTALWLVVRFGLFLPRKALRAVVDRFRRDLVVSRADHHPTDLRHFLAARVTAHLRFPRLFGGGGITDLHRPR